jgi:hypothetical protein
MKRLFLVLMLCLGMGTTALATAAPVFAAGSSAANTTFKFNGKTKNVTIRDVLIELLRFASVGVGLAAAGGYAWGGVTYSSAGGNPSQAQKGITIIVNTTIGIIGFFALYGITLFLLPENILI